MIWRIFGEMKEIWGWCLFIYYSFGKIRDQLTYESIRSKIPLYILQ